MRSIYTARDGLDANFLKALLVQEGVRAVVQGEALQEAWGNLNLTRDSLPTVWVDDADEAAALPIVDEYRRRDASHANATEADDATADVTARPTWTCATCGRANEQQFTACWHCGHDRATAAGGITTP
ncbi:MAG: hypothetical protein JWO31_1520 [Phycisphaerales bacterium]|nr:hypothetical protein [Phycisphaerales bacterium]